MKILACNFLQSPVSYSLLSYHLNVCNMISVERMLYKVSPLINVLNEFNLSSYPLFSGFICSTVYNLKV
jgi:hypothetical protein